MTGKELDAPVIVTVMDGYSSVSEALSVTLDELDLGREDAAASQLARRVAEVLDRERDGRKTAELARQMLAVLESLGATPAARKAVLPQGGPAERSPTQQAKDSLKAEMQDELNVRRAARGSTS
ncbi:MULTISPECIES: terminase small subunit [Amycolatopsis]|uniref:Terminase small subunit actinomycetes phage-type domain-containing protein n=2 Tax=Amycolatopsis roodepoortensis TaxID=700274 RepID=A0ABR9L2S0_9PSEU|nr:MULTISPECIES: hypothetical protein [Amycolatopsis]MBE1575054.1 hypothetical protein [Amycolatopsis roodepoortensis]